MALGVFFFPPNVLRGMIIFARAVAYAIKWNAYAGRPYKYGAFLRYWGVNPLIPQLVSVFTITSINDFLIIPRNASLVCSCCLIVSLVI